MPESNPIASRGLVKVQEFSYMNFNMISDYFTVRNVGEIDKELKNYLPKINELGQIYLDHEMHEKAGLALIHRHFTLQKGEMKVAKQVGNELQIAATMITEDKQDELIPYVFAVVRGDEGVPTLIPLEYADHSDKHLLREQLNEEFQSIQNHSFLNEFLVTSERLNVDGVFGIMLKSRDDIQVGSTECRLESGGGDVSHRHLVVKSVPKVESQRLGTTTVTWNFKKGMHGKIQPVGTCLSEDHAPSDKCQHNCCDHCTGAGHASQDCTNHCCTRSSKTKEDSSLSLESI